MASLNLCNWRQRPWYQRIWDYRYRYVMLIACVTAAATIVCYRYQPLLAQLQSQQQRNATLLAALPTVAEDFRQQRHQQQQRHYAEQSHRTQAAVLKELARLTQANSNKIDVTAVRWLPEELVIEGKYQGATSLEQYVAQLRRLYPDTRVQLRLPRDRRFRLDITPDKVPLG